MARASDRAGGEVREDELREAVEAIGLWFEERGLPRMAGRVVGWLLVCDPPEQTMQELADSLNASMGSISTMTRSLMQFGLIERISRPGERRVYYRIRPEGWTWTIEERLRRTAAFLDITDEALELLRDAPPSRRDRVERVAHAVRDYANVLSGIRAAWDDAPGTA